MSETLREAVARNGAWVEKSWSFFTPEWQRRLAGDMTDYPSLTNPGGRNLLPVEEQAKHVMAYQERLRQALTWALNHIAVTQLGPDYVTVPIGWTDRMIDEYEAAREMASPNHLTRLHR